MRMLLMKTFSFLALALAVLVPTMGFAEDWIAYEGKDGPGKGKHIVLLSGDEEYRSEEALPMLGKILSQRHGFKCTVLFSVDKDGVINPKAGGSLPGSEALDSADAIVMSLRFRHWPAETMKRFEAALNRGVPIVALRTSTHAFNGFPKGSPWEKWNYGNKGGFGKQVLGETWVTHWGNHKKEATKGIIESEAKNDPILRGVEEIFGTTDVYEAAPPTDAKVLVRGQVLKGMNPSDGPAVYSKKTVKGNQQDVNEPMMPVVWTRVYKNEAGKESKILCTTMGAATDLTNEGLRRMVVNGVYWGLGLEVPAKADVAFVDTYEQTMYGFDGFRKGLKASDHALGKVLPRGEAK
jgi:hypothetical protein